ncbi:hypothetical protein D3C73_494860 [compost metagenome]
MALEIEVHAFAEVVASKNGRDHPGDLGTLLVDRHRVEVVDLTIAVRARRMRQRASILRKLIGLQMTHVGNPFDRARTHVGGEFLVAIDREAFFQAKLEPVAAGDAVAGPVVKIFMRDDALDIGIILVGRGFRVGQHVFVVEDVETLVLHCPHVEIGDGDDLEYVQIVFAAEMLFVPLHRALQRIHGIGRTRFLAVLDIDLQRHFATGHRFERVFDDAEIACDQREEIGGLGMRIEPGGKRAAFVITGAAEEIAVRQHDRVGYLVTDDRDRVGRQNIRAIGEIGDAAKALGLALCAIHTVGPVKPH